MDARTPAKSLPADRRTSRSGPHQSAKSPTTITSPPKQWSGKAKSKSRNREKLSKSERQLSGGSKKANMNYLLGFQYEHARESNHHRSGSYSGRSPPQRTTRTSSAPRSKPLTREQYLQANAHFDVTQDCDLNVQLVDADIPVPWDQVVQVHLKTTQPQHCPICLAPPTAAKITRCGHVYCWPCIQHHLLLSEDAWADCPLCDDAVYARDLRPVCIAQVVQPKVDGALRFRLMRCQKGSSLAHPADLFAKLPQHTAVFDAQATNTPFLRYHRLSAADQHRIYAREAAELLTLQALEGDDPFVQSTSETLRKQWLALHPTQPATATLADLCSLPAPAQSPSPAVTGLELGPKPAVSKPAALNVHAPVFVPGGDSSDSLPFASADASVPSVQDVNGAAASMVEANVRVDDTGEEALYFYQAADGHAVFLSGINHKMLEQDYGDLSLAPPELVVKVLDLESVVVDEKLRKLRCLRHLPLHCQVYLAEVDLRQHIGATTMAAFADNLKRRQQRRVKTARQEQRMAVEAQRQLDQEWRQVPVLFTPEPDAFPSASPSNNYPGISP